MMTLPFASDGATLALPGNGIYPAAFHDSVGGKTWVTWQAFRNGHRLTRVATHDHGGAGWGPGYDVDVLRYLVNDDHGLPAIEMDHEGHVHAFYYPHDDPLQISSTLNPRDPSQWVYRAALGDDHTYPHPTQIGEVMHLFIRTRIASQTRRVLQLYKTTSLSGGVAVWGPPQTVIDFGSDSRVYNGIHVRVGTDVHFVCMRSNYDATIRRDAYHFIYDAVGESMRNADGSVVIPAAQFPINLETANASFRVVDQVPNKGDLAGFCIDAAGALHLLYIDIDGSSIEIKHKIFSGGAWSAPVTIGPVDATTAPIVVVTLTPIPLPDGSVELWYANAAAGAWQHGGNMVRRIWTVGTWSAEELMLAYDTHALAVPTAVRDPHPDCRVMFGEVKQSDADSGAGGLNLYAHGDNGFLPGAITEPLPAATGLLIDGSGPGSGSDPHFGSVVLLIDGS